MVPKKTPEKAPSTADNQSRDYELVLIISPEVADEDSDTVIDKVGQFVTENGGTTAEVEKWGRRKLAYPIERFLEGNYVLAHFALNPTLGKELEANLKISEDVLRHLLIRLS